MGSVYKPSWVDKDGKRHLCKAYRIVYKNASGERVTETAYSDKRASEELLRKREINVEREQVGLPVEGQGHLHKPLADALSSWAAELERLGRTPAYIEENRSVVRRVADWCGWKTLGAIQADGLRSYLSHLAKSQKSPRTVNQAREKVLMLCNFCIDQQWMERNPVARVKSTRGGARPRRRRAFTPEELQRLIGEAEPWHRPIYRVAALSGLRRSELRRLEKQDLTPIGDRPRWHLRAEISKARRADVVPMLPECVEVVRPIWEALVSPTARLFRTLPLPHVFNRQVKRAGIAKRDERDRQVDFHALRYLFCTQLARRLPIQLVSRLMRHNDIRMTAGLYLDLGIEDVAAELLSLPRILENPSAATGAPRKRKSSESRMKQAESAPESTCTPNMSAA